MEWLVAEFVMVGVMPLCGGETSLRCAKLGGFRVMLAAPWGMVKIHFFGRTFGWEKCRYGINLIGCIICPC